MHRSRGGTCRPSRARIPFLAAILVVGGLLRLYGIDFGLPYLYHVDEPSYILGAVRLGAGKLSSVPYDPTGFLNILFAEFVALLGGGWLFGFFHSASEFRALYETDQTAFYLLGRVTSALLGTLSVAAVYVIGKRARGDSTGLLGALFLAVAFLHVRDSHFATPDITAAFFIVVTVMLSTMFAGSGSAAHLYLAGLMAGLAIATKWNALPVLLAPIWALFGARHESAERPGNPGRTRSLALPVFGVVSGAVLGAFQILLDPAPYWGKVLTEYTRSKQIGYEGWYVDTVPASIFYLKTLSYGLGVPLLLLSVVGISVRLFTAFSRRDLVSQIVLTFPLPYAILMGTSNHFFSRYALPVVPFLALFAADGLFAVRSAIDRLTPVRRRGAILVGLLALVAVAPPLVRSVRCDALLRRDDTRTVAKQWIEANLAPGSRIAVDWFVYAPPLDSTQPTFPWVPRSTKQYDVVAMQYGFLHEKDTQWFREQGFEYLITSGFVYNVRWVSEEDRTRKQRFYEAVDREFELIRQFSPYKDEGGRQPAWNYADTYAPTAQLWRRQRPGPTLKIYKVR